MFLFFCGKKNMEEGNGCVEFRHTLGYWRLSYEDKWKVDTGMSAIVI